MPSIIRLFIDAPNLCNGNIITLDKKQSHYLVNVMRVQTDTILHVFNGQDGEWEAKVSNAHKKQCELTLTRQRVPFSKMQEVHLAFAPLKQTPQHFLIEKATELGVTHFHPITTERTIVRKINEDKTHAQAIEAAEQSGRLTVPNLTELASLDRFLTALDPVCDALYLCDERRTAPLLCAQFDSTKNTYFLIGPEGGFTPTEFSMILRHACAKPIRLSPHILRAETAGIAVLAQLAGLLERK